MIMTINSIIIMLISMLLMMLSSFISMKTFCDREKNSPFECGFDPKSSPRIPFSLPFFLIAVIFLVFDIEISLLIPLIFVMTMSNFLNYFLISMFFFLILLIGLYFEWHQGALNWLN
uniref:NADH-ubiquinone oxidoreductase chain 3 n=1 Tax=Pselaphinae sp. 6 EF-2015 TaxID=1756860 RepID=A0A0S2M8Q7_9COLE|nr:NADH deshydrogenase subunit 3 [Pselaphinae sp. 6 EF-2015]